MTAAAALAVLSFEVRKAWPDDQRFCAATFREQLARQHGGAPYRTVDRVVDRIFGSERTRVLVAADGHRIIGWLAYVEVPRVRAVLFAYVRKEHRGRGVASALAAQAWPRGTGSWVHVGLRGGSTKSLLEAHPSAIEMPIEELL